MKFAEHSGLNLFATNEEVLKMWDEQDLFHRSMTEREGCPSFVFFEVLLRPTDILAFTT